MFTYRDGRLREQDQILAIDGQPLDLSHHEAIRILQSAQGLVQLVVARGPYPHQQGDQPSSPHKQQLSNVQSEGSADMVVSITGLSCIMYSLRAQPIWF